MQPDDLSPAQQVEKALRIRDAKAKTAKRVTDPETGKDEIKLVPYEPNREGFYFDNQKRKWIMGIDPAGNLVPVMLSTCRDPATPSTSEAREMKGREDKGWLWLERIPYGFQGDWKVERVKVIADRRATHQAKARKDAPSQMQQLAATFHGEIRTLIESLGTVAKAETKAKPKDAG